MMLMIPQAASVLGCERLWLNINATLFFLSFHAGSHLTIGVASWTWSTFAAPFDLKRKLATKSCIASFLDPNLDPETGRYKISPPLKFTAPGSTFRPCSTCVSCSGGFFPAACLLVVVVVVVVVVGGVGVVGVVVVVVVVVGGGGGGRVVVVVVGR